MPNPESLQEIGRSSRAVGSPAPDTGQYQHSACSTETFNKGGILPLCANPSCPNKGGNWAMQAKLTEQNRAECNLRYLGPSSVVAIESLNRM